MESLIYNVEVCMLISTENTHKLIFKICTITFFLSAKFKIIYNWNCTCHIQFLPLVKWTFILKYIDIFTLYVSSEARYGCLILVRPLSFLMMAVITYWPLSFTDDCSITDWLLSFTNDGSHYLLTFILYWWWQSLLVDFYPFLALAVIASSAW